nr:MAG TPA: hypothetical protein [Caudoviricetes sp.]
MSGLASISATSRCFLLKPVLVPLRFNAYHLSITIKERSQFL